MDETNNPDETITDWKTAFQELNWEDDEARREEDIQRRFQHRARQYAALLPEESESEAAAHALLAFTLGSERYAVDVMSARAIRTLPKITPVPGTPRFYRGVVNLRGQIITVIDLRLFFDMQIDDQEPPGELVVIHANNLELGLLAHHVHGTLTVMRSTIEPTPEIRYARGVTQDHMVLLDIATLFEDSRLIVGGKDD